MQWGNNIPNKETCLSKLTEPTMARVFSRESEAYQKNVKMGRIMGDRVDR